MVVNEETKRWRRKPPSQTAGHQVIVMGSQELDGRIVQLV